jgi:hypothetical protein
MKLLRSKISPTGVIFATYEPDGPVKTGSFVGQNPSEEEMERRRRLE